MKKQTASFDFQYKAINYRYTMTGWVMDIRKNGAVLPVSITMDEVNAAECQNFDQAYQAQKTLPYNPEWGDVFPIAGEQPADLGTHFVISGGEVMELENISIDPDEPPSDLWEDGFCF